MLHKVDLKLVNKDIRYLDKQNVHTYLDKKKNCHFELIIVK